MSKEQDKNAKALALLTKNKEAGRLSIDDPEAMMQKLTERYGDKAYDLVVNALVKPKTVMDDLGQTGVKPSSANTLNYLISDEISKENIAKLGGQVAYGEDYQGARKDAQEKCQIASETIAQAKDDWANYIQSIIEPHISPAQRAETVIVAKEDNANANAAIAKTQEEIGVYKNWQDFMSVIPTFTPQFFNKEQEEVTIPLRPKEETKDRDTLNAEYADQMRDPNNWKEVKVEEAVQMPQEKDIGVMYAAPEMPSTGGYTPEYDAAIRGKDTKETVVEMQMAPEMPTTGGYTPEYDAAIRGKDTKETVVEMQMAPEMPTTGGYTPEYDAAIRGKESESKAQAAPSHTTEKGTHYTVSENGISIDRANAPALGNIDRLMPKAYEIDDKKGMYACGPVRATIQSAGRMASQTRLKTTMIEHDVYNDMQKRQANGEKLSQIETTFMQKHEKDLKDWSLENVNGSLVQTNPRGMQLTPTRVKNADAMAKQIEKDKKAATKDTNNKDLLLLMAQQKTK